MPVNAPVYVTSKLRHIVGKYLGSNLGYPLRLSFVSIAVGVAMREQRDDDRLVIVAVFFVVAPLPPLSLEPGGTARTKSTTVESTFREKTESLVRDNMSV